MQAFSTQAKLVLGQVEVDGKSNEIPALPRLLELLDVEGRLVTADAMHAQRDAAAAVVSGGGDYVLALKGNQETLHDDVRLYLEAPPKGRGSPFASGGRQGPRAGRDAHGERLPRCRLAARAARLAGPGGGRKGRGDTVDEARRGDRGDAPLPAQRPAVGGGLRTRGALALGDRELAALGVDVTLNEDAQRNRTGHGARNLAALRRLALNVARAQPDKGSMRGKIKRAGWDDDFLLDMVRAAQQVK